MDKLISLSRLFDYIREHSEQALSSNEKNELEQIWDSSDTLNCFGKPLKKGYTDNVLIDEEWQVFKSKIPNCSENLKNIITDFAKYMDLMKNKNEILANNIYTSCIDLYDINKIGENLKQVNKYNLFDVLKNYYVINPDGSFFSFIARTGIIMSLEDEQEECDKIKTKLIECSKIIIENAKSKNVYCKDYEKIINKKLSDIKNNINGKIAWKELAYATDRLYERTIVTADKNRKKEVIEPNGKFDKEFYQGYTCDCWLLSALRAICNNEFALEKINDIVSVQKDKNFIKSVGRFGCQSFRDCYE